MPPSAHGALVVSVIASALGALIMCLLVARYGLTPGVQEDADAAARRLIVTRLGHAFAGVCFAVTGVLGLVTVTVQAREAPPPPTVIVEPDPSAEERLQALLAEMESIAARLNQVSTRVDQVSTRVAAADTTARRLGDEVASVQLRARQLERAVAALPRRAPAPMRPAAPAVPAPQPGADVPGALPATPPQEPAPRSPAAGRRPEPPAAPQSLPAASRAPEPAAAPRTAGPPAPPTIQAPRGGAEGGAAAAGRDDLSDKLREDWKAVREGFATAGDDLKDALRDLGRKLWR